MIGKYKPFEQLEYDECNDRAIEKVKNFLKSMRFSIVEKKSEDMLVDITAVKNGKTTYHEVELRPQWKHEWPKWWPKINIPERKGSFNTVNHFFYILSNDMTKAWFIKGIELIPERLEEVPNIKVAKGEYFYRIPIELARKIKL